MVTIIIAALAVAVCTVARRSLNRPGREERSYLHGTVVLSELWNEGAAFELPIQEKLLYGLSVVALVFLWVKRRQCPIGIGFAIGGGISNLWERLRHGRVYDYIRFPKLPTPREYVYNLADLLIFFGAFLFFLRRIGTLLRGLFT